GKPFCIKVLPLLALDTELGQVEVRYPQFLKCTGKLVLRVSVLHAEWIFPYVNELPNLVFDKDREEFIDVPPLISDGHNPGLVTVIILQLLYFGKDGHLWVLPVNITHEVFFR